MGIFTTSGNASSITGLLLTTEGWSRRSRSPRAARRPCRAAAAAWATCTEVVAGEGFTNAHREFHRITPDSVPNARRDALRALVRSGCFRGLQRLPQLCDLGAHRRDLVRRRADR